MEPPMAEAPKTETPKLVPLKYEEVVAELKKPATVLIDVRTKEEIQQDGKIQGSKNMPIIDLIAALKLSDEEFLATYGFAKPAKQANIICHCKMGLRAEKGAKMFMDAGYSDVKYYPGILDWKHNGGAVVNSNP